MVRLLEFCKVVCKTFGEYPLRKTKARFTTVFFAFLKIAVHISESGTARSCIFNLFTQLVSLSQQQQQKSKVCVSPRQRELQNNQSCSFKRKSKVSSSQCYKTNTAVIYCHIRLNYHRNIYNIEFNLE